MSATPKDSRLAPEIHEYLVSHGTPPDEIQQGLIDVTQKRDRAWLGRWLANPAQMLAEQDPVAMRLYSEWDEVIMPNLRLNEVEVDALLEYMDAESRRVHQTSPVAGAAGVHAPEPHQH